MLENPLIKEIATPFIVGIAGTIAVIPFLKPLEKLTEKKLLDGSLYLQ